MKPMLWQNPVPDKTDIGSWPQSDGFHDEADAVANAITAIISNIVSIS